MSLHGFWLERRDEGRRRPVATHTKSTDSTPRTMARIAEARQRNAARLERPSLKVKRISEKVTHTDVTSDMAETLLDTFGTTSSDFVHAELSRLPGEQREINAALAAIDGTRPANELAAMLASQMVVTHGLAMDMLGRVRRADLLVQAEALGALATKLLRTYTIRKSWKCWPSSSAAANRRSGLSTCTFIPAARSGRWGGNRINRRGEGEG